MRGQPRGRPRGRPHGRSRGASTNSRISATTPQGSLHAVKFSSQNPSESSQLLQCCINVLSFYCREHLSLPYMCPYDPGEQVAPDVDPAPHLWNQEPTDLTDQTNIDIVTNQNHVPIQTDHTGNESSPDHDAEESQEDYTNIYSDNRFIKSGHFNMRTEVLSNPWMYEHEGVRQSLLSYATCFHAAGADTICEACRDPVENSHMRIQFANPVLSKMLEQPTHERNLIACLLRQIALSTEKIIRIHMKVATGFFKQMDLNMRENCYSYWSSSGRVNTSLLDSD